MAIGLANGRGRVWDIGTRRLLLDVLVADPAGDQIWYYVHAGISGDGRTVAFAAFHYPPVNRTEITFYDVDTGIQLAETWRVEGAASNRIGASPDGAYLVATTTAGLRRGVEPARAPRGRPADSCPRRAARRWPGSAATGGTWPSAAASAGRGLWQVERLVVHVAGRRRPQRVRRRAELLARRQRCWPARVPTQRSSCTTWAPVVCSVSAFGPDRNSWLYAEYRADRNEMIGYFDDGSMVRWDVDPKSQVRTACKIAGRDMTRARVGPPAARAAPSNPSAPAPDPPPLEGA